jgi:hypothetical protein
MQARGHSLWYSVVWVLRLAESPSVLAISRDMIAYPFLERAVIKVVA